MLANSWNSSISSDLCLKFHVQEKETLDADTPTLHFFWGAHLTSRLLTSAILPVSSDAGLPRSKHDNEQRAGKGVRWSLILQPMCLDSSWDGRAWLLFPIPTAILVYLLCWLVNTKCVSRLRICQLFKNKIATAWGGKKKGIKNLWHIIIP